MFYFILIQSLVIFGFYNETGKTKLQENQLEVIVQNVRPSKGHIRVCLFDNEKDFFGNACKCYDVSAPEDKHSIMVAFTGLENNHYAIAVYQDFNQNGILDRNWLGLPREPYGFSNNPSTFFGPPRFSRVSFEIKESKKIVIRL